MDLIRNYGWPALAVALLVFSFVTANPVLQLFSRLGTGLALCGTAISFSNRFGTAATALFAAWANGYLLWDKIAPAEGPSICSVNDVVNCSKVAELPEGMLGGIPVTLLGVAFYVGLAIASLMPERSTPRLPQLTGFFMLPAIGFSIYLGNATVQANLVCAFCYTIYAANLFLFGAAMRGMKANDSKLFDDLAGLAQSNGFLGVTGVFVVGVAAGMGAISGEEPPPPKITETEDPSASVAKLYAKAGGPIELDGLEPLYGRPDARYQVVEWADFGCGHCAHAFPELHDLVDNNPDISVRFKNYPLAGQCNPNLQEGREGLCVAAIAAECAHKQEKFWPYAEQIFLNQQGLSFSPEDFEFLAGFTDLDVAAWRECMVDPKSIEPVLSDALSGATAEIQGTPALFVKGVYGDEWVAVNHTPADLARLIEAHRDGVSLPAPQAHQAH